MKRLSQIVTLLLVCSISIFMACEGPSGSEGPQGPEGPEGPVGPAGEDGSQIHAGTGAPSADLGSEGDYYLDQNTGDLYGPKNDQGWGTPISLQGPPGDDGQDGQDGEDGSQIYSGTSAPQPSMGKEGDYYLNTSTFDLYGPKTNSGWGTPINLKGTANVMYSDWVNPPQWKGSTQTTTKYRYFDISANAMTQDIIDKGIVKVYTNFNTTSTYSLPLGKGDSPATPNYSFFFELEPQQIRIGYMDPDAIGTLPRAIGTSSDFRYVLIPGGKSLKTKVQAGKLPIDLNNYQEVKKYFGISK